MARILISYFSDYGETMYDAVSSELLQYGNDIFRLNINTNKVTITGWGKDSQITDFELLDNIRSFSPEIIFNYNNSLPQNVPLNNSCKNCLIDADNPETFWNQSILKNKLSSYFFIGLQSYSKSMYSSFLKVEIKENLNYLYLPPASTIISEPLIVDKNISFIGSNFYPLAIPNDEDFYGEIGLKLAEKFKQNYFYSYQEASQLCENNKLVLDEDLFEKVRAYYVGQERLKFMQSVEDLGFVYYGVRWWSKIAYYDFELASCFDKKNIQSLKENQWVYNTSKISINISHPQAKSSFSWRVMDIMASQSCLLMESKTDWHALFGSYISDEVKEAIIYNDRYDMRQKALFLLDNENFRLRCVRECNAAISENGRWIHRFKQLEKFLSIPILNEQNNDSIYINIKRKSKDYARTTQTITQGNDVVKNKRPNIFGRLKIKIRAKNIIYLFLLLIAQLPIIDKIINKKNRGKLYKKINRYKR